MYYIIYEYSMMNDTSGPVYLLLLVVSWHNEFARSSLFTVHVIALNTTSTIITSSIIVINALTPAFDVALDVRVRQTTSNSAAYGTYAPCASLAGDCSLRVVS